MLKLFDIINLYKSDILPSDCKLHLACWNGTENPMDEYLSGTFEEWQSWQNKRNFQRKYIISLIQLPASDQWLLGGVFNSLKCEYIEEQKCYHYSTRELPDFKEFTGRLILSFKRTGRQSYLYLEKLVDKIIVSELKSKKITIQKFKGYDNTLISKHELDIIVKQNISSWESALANVAGVYLITDTANGKQYVGSATGKLGIWQRWSEYSKNGHGGNKELKKILNQKGEEYSNNFQYSILEIADTHSSTEDILKRESFWKDVLCSRSFGYNGEIIKSPVQMDEYIQLELKSDFLKKHNLPNVHYPIPTSSLQYVLNSGGNIDLHSLLFWFQCYSSSLKNEWKEIEPALLRLAQILATKNDDSVGDIYTPDFYLHIKQMDISQELITISRKDKVLVAIQPHLNLTISIAVFYPLDAKTISLLIDLGKCPHPQYGVSMRKNNWEYALDVAAQKTSSIYAKERGDSYLSYWNNGLKFLSSEQDDMNLKSYHTKTQMKPNIVASQIGTYYERMED